jgi:hypothetical protein
MYCQSFNQTQIHKKRCHVSDKGIKFHNPILHDITYLIFKNDAWFVSSVFFGHFWKFNILSFILIYSNYDALKPAWFRVTNI